MTRGGAPAAPFPPGEGGEDRRPAAAGDGVGSAKRGNPLSPSYSGPGWALYTGNCIEVISTTIPEASVDLIFADPPYNLSNGGTTCRSGKRASVNKGRWDRSEGFEADHAFHAAWLRACRRVLAPTGTLWASGTEHVIFTLGYELKRAGWHILNLVTWEKPNPPPNLGCRTFTASTELLIWAAPRRTQPLAHTFNYAALKADNGGKQMKDVWRLSAPTKAEKAGIDHPTQKPEALLERIIAASSAPGDVVLDPFVGGGTTGAVAVRQGRRFIGIDLDEKWVGTTARRIG